MKERKRLAELVEEEEYRRQLMAKFAEDDRIELMNAQKRRMKQLEHRRAVEKLIEERRQEYQKLKVRSVRYYNSSFQINTYQKYIAFYCLLMAKQFSHCIC